MVNHNLFTNKELFYSVDPHVIYDKGDAEDSWQLSDIKINNLKQHRLCVLDFSAEHWGAGTIDHIYQRLVLQKLNFILLSFDPTDHMRLPNLFFLPFWYHNSIKLLKPQLSNSLPKKFKWSCLNANPKSHRIYNYIYSIDQPYYNNVWFSMFNFSDYSVRPDEFELDAPVLDKWNKLKIKLPTLPSQPGFPYATTEANTNSYIHLVTESTVVPKVFITEKTWKPIAYEQIFLIYSNPGTVAFLRSIGVDVFDDLIDHGYDSEPDWKIRCHMIHQQLEKLLSMDLYALYQKTQQRRAANKEKFYSGYFGGEFLKEIYGQIDKKLC